jgi:hypothetical protein
LLKEAVGALQYADDSDGDIDFLVTQTLELIEEIVTNQNKKGHITFKNLLFFICFV